MNKGLLLDTCALLWVVNEPELLTNAFSLPSPFHKDPCDRIIVGSARQLSLQIVTGDRKINEYPFVEKIL